MKYLSIVIAMFILVSVNVFAQIQCHPDYKVNPNEELQKKEQHIKQVAELIWSTITQPFHSPEIICFQEDGTSADAFYCPDKNQIYFGSNLYDICMEVSKEALAAIVAHEMGHYFYHHSFAYSASGYALSSKEFDISSELDVAASEELEAQADIFAAMKCYNAGYDITEAMPKVLQKVYENNASPKKLSGYMPLSRRMEVAEKAHNIFVDILPLYNAATYLYLLGEYRVAGDIFTYIGQDYTSWEVYVNAAVCYALEAIDYMKPESKKYIFPFQMQANSNISAIHDFAQRGSGGRDEDYIVDYMLEKAENRMNTALDKNPEVFGSQLTMAGIMYYRNRIAVANSHAEDAYRLAENNTNIALALTAKAIIMVADGKENVARQAFDSAVSYGGLSITSLNKCIFNGSDCSEFFSTIDEIQEGVLIEEICSKEPYSLIYDRKYNWKDTTSVAELDQLVVFEDLNDECRSMKIENQNGSVVLLETGDNYKDSTARGIKKGSSRDLVLEKYGKPAFIRAHGDGEYLIYKSTEIGFKVVAGKVDSWMIFYSK
jgi:tetratricopeptide (TPR) repeat protein